MNTQYDERDLDLDLDDLNEQASERHGQGMSWWMVVALLLSVAAVLYVILGVEDDAVYAYTVDQAVAQKSSLEGKMFRVKGLVKEGTILNKPGTLDTRFDLIHNDQTITVAYDKPLPDTFKAGIEVLAEGRLQPSGVLKADDVIAKCPSKYEEQAGGMPPGKAKHPEGIPKKPLSKASP
ncbi:MAG: cytochrome c maturation protein CcmE [Myxococcota bacterium]